jgi:hypothetical protein
MNVSVKKIVAKWLEENDYDGLINPDVPCCCLRDDPGECDELGGGSDCFAGCRRDVAANEKCGCEKEGTAHYHIDIGRGRK